MPPPFDLQDSGLAAWATNSRVSAYLIEHIPTTLWSATVPGVPSRTIRPIGAHLHNSRCSWIKTLGHEHGIAALQIDSVRFGDQETVGLVAVAYPFAALILFLYVSLRGLGGS